MTRIRFQHKRKEEKCKVTQHICGGPYLSGAFVQGVF